MMNILVQNILVLLVFAAAIGFLIKKFFWNPRLSSAKKKKIGTSCSSDCGCH